MPEDDPPFPAACLRGIRKPEWVERHPGYVDIGSHAFLPDKNSRADGSGSFETSVTWHDNEEALRIAQATNARFGLACLQTQSVDEVANDPSVSGDLSYERKPIRGNRHHGNLLFQPHGEIFRKYYYLNIAGELARRAVFLEPAESA